MNAIHARENIVMGMMKQKRAHDELVALLDQRIRDVEGEKEEFKTEAYAYYFFLCGRNKLIREFVEYVYSKYPKQAKSMVEAYHDDQLDLTTIGCTGKDFEPWE